MKSFLLNGFEDFITGSGIWILVGCLAFALLVAVLFLILNIEKEKKMQQHKSTPIVLTTEEEKPKAERIQPVEVKVSKVEEEKVEEVKVEEPKKVETTKTAPKKAAPKKEKVEKEANTENEEKVEKETSKKAAVKKETEKKTTAKKETTKKSTSKKVEPKEEVKEELPEESGNYEISYDAESKQWVVKRETNARATKRTKTKQQAIDYAKPLAEKHEVKLVIHTKKDSE